MFARIYLEDDKTLEVDKIKQIDESERVRPKSQCQVLKY